MSLDELGFKSIEHLTKVIALVFYNDTVDKLIILQAQPIID